MNSSEEQDFLDRVFSLDGEAALFQHAKRADVVVGDVGMQRADGNQLEKQGKSFGGKALPPETLAKPVPDVVLIVLSPAHDVARYLPIENDDALDDRSILEHLAPMSHVSVMDPGRNVRHLNRNRILLVIKEDEQIVFVYFPQ